MLNFCLPDAFSLQKPEKRIFFSWAEEIVNIQQPKINQTGKKFDGCKIFDEIFYGDTSDRRVKKRERASERNKKREKKK